MGKTRKPPAEKAPPALTAEASKFFRAAVESMIERGYVRNSIGKMAFRLDDRGKPVCIRSHTAPLTQGELERPEFWMPTGFDGEGVKVELCAPGWFGDRKAATWIKTWSEAFAWPHHGEVSSHPGKFVGDQLATLRMLAEANLPKIPTAAAEKAKAGAGYLTQAMAEAYAAGGGFPPRSIQSLTEGETLPLKPDLAQIIELAFRAGACSSKAAWEYRGITRIARRGKPQVDQQGKGKRKRPEESLPPWAQEALRILRKDSKTPQQDILDALVAKGLAVEEKSSSGHITGRIKLGGEKNYISTGAFKTRISKLKPRLKE